MTERPNIVLVTVDSLRADHCGFLGYEKDTTPNLDAMAEEGVVFENAVAPGPATPESMPAIFTGRHPTILDVENAASTENRQERIRTHMRARTTVPEMLKERGYTTVGFTPNPYTSRHYAFEEGFDHFEDYLGSESREKLFTLVKQSSIPFVRAAHDWVLRERSFKSWESFYDEITSKVENIEEPYFLWILLMDTHTPYFAPRSHRVENSWWQMIYSTLKLRTSDFESRLAEDVHANLISAYDDSIRYADEFFGRLLSEFDESDPLYLVHSDHGEGFMEHKSYYHRKYLYRENLHVPFLIANTGTSATIETPVSLTSLPDILQTLVSDSVSDLPAKFKHQKTSATAKSREGSRIAARRRDQKMVVGPGGINHYDTVSDPQEQQPADYSPDAKRCLDSIWQQLIEDEELRRISKMAGEIDA